MAAAATVEVVVATAVAAEATAEEAMAVGEVTVEVRTVVDLMARMALVAADTEAGPDDDSSSIRPENADISRRWRSHVRSRCGIGQHRLVAPAVGQIRKEVRLLLMGWFQMIKADV